jgi:hypothetical protein
MVYAINKNGRGYMTYDEIIKKVNDKVLTLDGVPSETALPELRKVLWDIGEEIGIDGAEVFKIYMDWLSK